MWKKGPKTGYGKVRKCLVKLGIIKKGLMGYSSPVLLVKRKHQNVQRVSSDFCVLNNTLVKINHASPLVWDCIQVLDHSHCKAMSVAE